MLIRPKCILKGSSIPPSSRSATRPRPTHQQTAVFEHGGRILWNQRTARLMYEQANGARGALAIAYEENDPTNGMRCLELPAPANAEQARALVYTLAAALNVRIEEVAQAGLVVWIIRVP